MSADWDFGTFGVAVGVSAVRLSAASVSCTRGVYVKAAPGNTGVVYIGAQSGVTAGTTDATDGYPLSAGHEVYIPINDVNKVWAIGSAASQKVFCLPV